MKVRKCEPCYKILSALSGDDSLELAGLIMEVSVAALVNTYSVQQMDSELCMRGSAGN